MNDELLVDIRKVILSYRFAVVSFMVVILLCVGFIGYMLLFLVPDVVRQSAHKGFYDGLQEFILEYKL